MGGPHSLLAMDVSVEKQTLDHIWYRGRARQKNQHVVNFQTTENKLIAMWSSKDEDAQGVAFIRWKTKNIIWDMIETQVPK